MQSLPENKILRYRPDTMMEIRKQYNLEKPGQIEEAVEILDDWVKKQDHFMKKDFAKEYLERVIIMLKGSVERAKTQLDKICTLRTAMPKFFKLSDPQYELKELHGYAALSLLPTLTKEHQRIFMLRISADGPHTQYKYFLIQKYSIIISEYIKSHDYCDGLIAITDLRGINMIDFVSNINLTDLRQIATIVMEGYASRMKGIHYISESKAIDMLVKILRQILNEKVANRIHVHKTVEELYDFIPRESLPKDYGGYDKCLDELTAECLQVLSSEENKKYLKEIRNARTNESRRPIDTSNENYLGLAGTFRTLNVD